jgi:hypothetical protein
MEKGQMKIMLSLGPMRYRSHGRENELPLP